MSGVRQEEEGQPQSQLPASSGFPTIASLAGADAESEQMIAVPPDTTPFRRKAPPLLPPFAHEGDPATDDRFTTATGTGAIDTGGAQKTRRGGGNSVGRVTGCLVLCWVVLVVFTLAMVFVAMRLVGTPPGGGTKLRVVGPAVAPGPGARTDVVAVCHPRWHGIRAATYQMGVAVIESADLSTPAAQSELAEELRMRGAKAVVFNGVIDGTLEACAALRKALPGVHTALTFHGSFAQHALTSEGQLLQRLVDAATGDAHSRPLWRLGFLKESIAAWLAEFAHVPAYPLANFKRPTAIRLGKCVHTKSPLFFAFFCSHASIPLHHRVC
jgi:hypothetical protein